MCGVGECDGRIVHAGVVSVPEHPVTPHPSRDVYTWPYDLDAKFEDGWVWGMGAHDDKGGVVVYVTGYEEPAPKQEVTVYRVDVYLK